MGTRRKGRGVAVGAGALKGRALRYPDGAAVRPTAQRTRESLFDSLGERVRGAVFADLYAGSGAVGIEALSRGARRVHFVESGSEALECLRANLASCRIEPAGYRIHAAPVAEILERRPSPIADATIVFADPPYDLDVGELILGRCRPGDFDALDVLVVEHRSRRSLPAPAGMVLDRSRRLGDTTLTYFVPSPDGA
jgi:16S rRNA (guanine(966)-N(2))-methyltransferase RsmD